MGLFRRCRVRTGGVVSAVRCILCNTRLDLRRPMYRRRTRRDRLIVIILQVRWHSYPWRVRVSFLVQVIDMRSECYEIGLKFQKKPAAFRGCEYDRVLIVSCLNVLAKTLIADLRQNLAEFGYLARTFFALTAVCYLISKRV